MEFNFLSSYYTDMSYLTANVAELVITQELNYINILLKQSVPNRNQSLNATELGLDVAVQFER